ncbi:MAG: type II toxin-antitoxin system ParD family antitoxin [Bacteroidales bacterium]|nr:type II toxin-antitoxin system ParD family antitoxin [Bacteroidales bacterium]
MAKNTSILLGNYFENFIKEKIKSGQFSSASEVVRAALRMFEHEETKKDELIKELKKGEKSGFITDFDRNKFLKNIHEKHMTE